MSDELNDLRLAAGDTDRRAEPLVAVMGGPKNWLPSSGENFFGIDRSIAAPPWSVKRPLSRRILLWLRMFYSIVVKDWWP